jgi:hypothetical protein
LAIGNGNAGLAKRAGNYGGDDATAKKNDVVKLPSALALENRIAKRYTDLIAPRALSVVAMAISCPR